MEKLKEKLWETLQQLKKEEFQKFKWLLGQKVVEGFPGIAVAQLETANRLKTVDLIVQKYQDSGALQVTLTVLRKISRNDLVDDLWKETKDFKGKFGSKSSSLHLEFLIKTTTVQGSSSGTQETKDQAVRRAEPETRQPTYCHQKVLMWARLMFLSFLV